MQLLETLTSVTLWLYLGVVSVQVMVDSVTAAAQESISENPCPDPAPSPMTPSMDFVLVSEWNMEDEFWRFGQPSQLPPYHQLRHKSSLSHYSVARRMSDPFYVPMGSKQMFNSYAEYLLGRAPKSQDELDEMNLRVAVSPMLTMITTGFNERFIQQCVPAFSFSRAYCFAGLGSHNTNLNGIRRSTNTLIWSDNKTAALITRCVLGFQNDWQVLSTGPTLDDSVKLVVLNKIKQLGFNTTLAMLGKYK